MTTETTKPDGLYTVAITLFDGMTFSKNFTVKEEAIAHYDVYKDDDTKYRMLVGNTFEEIMKHETPKVLMEEWNEWR